MHVHVFLMLCVAFAVVFSPSDGIFLDFWLRRAVPDVFGTRSGLESKKVQKKLKKSSNFIEIWTPKGPHFEPLAALVALRGSIWTLRGGKRCGPRLKIAFQGHFEIGDFSTCFSCFLSFGLPCGAPNVAWGASGRQLLGPGGHFGRLFRVVFEFVF